MKSNYIVIGLIILTLYYIVTVAFRLMPESSLFADGRVAVEKNNSNCMDCHSRQTLPIESTRGITDKLYCPSEQEKIKKQTNHPLYQGNCDELLAFFEIVRIRDSFPIRSTTTHTNPLIVGERLARRNYCFQCHGELGQGGWPNESSLKGYIPGYYGNDFRQLTNNGDLSSIKEWIRYGIDQNILDRPLEGYIAKYFITNQFVNMPHFNYFSEEDLTALVQYVSLLQLFGPLSAEKARKYERYSTKELDYNEIKEILSE